MLFSSSPRVRLLVGALLLSVPALTLVPGCGGGSSGSPARAAFTTRHGVALLSNVKNSPTRVIAYGNLTLDYADAPSGSQRAVSGFLQVLGSSAIPPNPAPQLPQTVPTAGPSSGIVVQPGSYVVTGTASPSGDLSSFPVQINGAFSPGIAFSLQGQVVPGQVIVSRSQLQEGLWVLPILILDDPVAFTTNTSGTPGATTVGTTVATTQPTATATATGTATATTPPIVGTPPSP